MLQLEAARLAEENATLRDLAQEQARYLGITPRGECNKQQAAQIDTL